MADEEEVQEETISPFLKEIEEHTIPFYKYWYYTAKRWYDTVTDIPRRIHCFWLRGKNGYCYRDLWGFDTYLSDVISKGLRDLAKNTHGYPDHLVGSFENWQRLLFIMADAFEEHNHEDDLYEEDRKHYSADEAIARSQDRYEMRKEKMKLIADYWGNLWD